MIGVPGLGKTSLINKMKESCQASKRCGIEISRSDEVRSAVLAAEYATRGLVVDNLTQEEIFQVEVDCGPKTKKELNKDIVRKLTLLHDAPVDRKIFVLDKNYCSKALVDYIEDQTKEILSDCLVHRCVVVPQNFGESGKNSIGPFDFDTLVIGLIRSLTRQNHITMNHGDTHTLLSFMSCLQSQVGDVFEDKFPKSRFPTVTVPFYQNQTVTNFKATGNLSDQYERLKQVISEIANKKAQVTDHVQFICSTINQLRQMNSFVSLDEANVQSVISNILAV